MRALILVATLCMISSPSYARLCGTPDNPCRGGTTMFRDPGFNSTGAHYPNPYSNNAQPQYVAPQQYYPQQNYGQNAAPFQKLRRMLGN